MDERAFMSKQLKWNKFQFYGDSLPSSLRVLILTVNNQRQFMLNVT